MRVTQSCAGLMRAVVPSCARLICALSDAGIHDMPGRSSMSRGRYFPECTHGLWGSGFLLLPTAPDHHGECSRRSLRVRGGRVPCNAEPGRGGPGRAPSAQGRLPTPSQRRGLDGSPQVASQFRTPGEADHRSIGGAECHSTCLPSAFWHRSAAQNHGPAILPWLHPAHLASFSRKREPARRCLVRSRHTSSQRPSSCDWRRSGHASMRDIAVAWQQFTGLVE